MLSRSNTDLENEKSINKVREKKTRDLLKSVTDYLKLQSSRLILDKISNSFEVINDIIIMSICKV